MWNGKKNRWMRISAGLLSAVLMAVTPQTVPAVQKGVAQEQQLPTGGRMDFVTESVTRVVSEGTDNGLSLRSLVPALQQYEWDCYSSDYYYSKLSSSERLLYERLDAVCGEMMLSSGADAASYEVKAKNTGNIVKRRGTKMVSCRGLKTEQVQKVLAIFCYANPQYYFINNQFLTKKNNDQQADPDTCALGIYDAFAKGSERAQATQEVFAQLGQLQAQVNADATVYGKYLGIHDAICDDLVYLSGDNMIADSSDPFYTQSVYGALINGETVCAGYTKLYSMLCNYFGMDCIAVTSKGHAWNQVRYGDHWYIVDVTWDDTSGSQRFFHITKQQMTETDQDASHVPNEFYKGILPEADMDFADDLKTMQGLEQPQVTISDTAAGVTIAMKSLQGDIYYTLDGSVPGVSDRYEAPIELTDNGTYIVTAVAAREGMISSAYEIFPVRIAGGSVSITSATNVKGKKIRVQFYAKKTYTGYEISYASKKDFSNQKSAKVKSKEVVISGLKKGKTYYIRVRGYKKDAYGNYYYTPYSKVKKVTVKK